MDLANEVRGLLKIFGIRLPKNVKHGSFDGVRGGPSFSTSLQPC
jgi:hypothetical protein